MRCWRQEQHQGLVTERAVRALRQRPVRPDLLGDALVELRRICHVAAEPEENLDEYRAEAQTITLRRREARSVEDVRRIAHEEFVHS